MSILFKAQGEFLKNHSVGGAILFLGKQLKQQAIQYSRLKRHLWLITLTSNLLKIWIFQK